MSVHINEVLDYLDAHPIGCYEGGLYPFMEMLHDAYIEQNSIDSEEIHTIFRGFNSMLEKISSEDTENIYKTVCDLCMGHEVIAFAHGIAVGMHLMTEVNYLP